MADATAPAASRRILNPTNVIAFSLLFFSSIWLAWWFYDRSNYVYVTDARITSTMISISSRIPGWVVEFTVSEGSTVNVGDVLVQIDPRDAELRLAEIEASLSTMRAEYDRQQSQLELSERQVNSRFEAEKSKLDAATSGSSEARIELSQAKREFSRAKSLLQQNMISEEDYDNRKSELDRTAQSYKRSIADTGTAKAELLLSEANLSELDVIKKEMQIISAREAELKIQRDRLRNTLDDHTIKSPITGVVDESFANQGEYVYPGQRILMIHNPNKIWIKANVKETEIRHLRLGSSVRINVDAFPNEEFHGTVRNIGHSATSQFALLPSPNPSGNFTKVTQRLEVQVDIETDNDLLKPGMMVELAIDVANFTDFVDSNTAVSRN